MTIKDAIDGGIRKIISSTLELFEVQFGATAVLEDLIKMGRIQIRMGHINMFYINAITTKKGVILILFFELGKGAEFSLSFTNGKLFSFQENAHKKILQIIKKII